MAFLDTIGDIGEALGGIPYGLNQGLAPFTTWENVRKGDLSNDAQEILNRNASLLQGAREAAPNYYGDIASQAQTEAQAKAAQNQYDVFNRQQALAMGQYGVSPAGQAALAGLAPGSAAYDTALAQMQSQFNPFGVPAFYNQTIQPLRAQAGAEQAAATYGTGILANYYGLDPSEIQLQRGPNGDWVASAFGQQLDIPREALITMAGMSGIKGPSEFRDAQIRNVQAMQTANANNFTNIYKTIVQDEMRNDPQFNAAMTQAGKRVEDFQKDLQQLRNNPLADPAEVAAANQRYLQAAANFDQLQQMAVRQRMARTGAPSALYGGPQVVQQPATQLTSNFRVPTANLFGPQMGQPGAAPRQLIRFAPGGVVAGQQPPPSLYGMNNR